jgi:comEA protein
MKIGRDQFLGSFALLVLTALFFLPPSTVPGARDTRTRYAPFSTETPGAVAVELTGDSGCNGVYFILKGTSLADFLDMAGVARDKTGNIMNSAPVFMTPTSVSLLHKPARIEFGPMSAQKRLSLAIPINLNRATLEELSLVSGIGEKTAEKILQHRTEEGAFRKLDELMQVKGIKEKRFEKLRRYFCIGC